ncbi:MAG: CAP domain-containing protein [Candidatus Micrarchaeota archaeon]|nr:CAP domain-containing protein [Candidatus Micrarchaeota archaeon]
MIIILVFASIIWALDSVFKFWDIPSMIENIMPQQNKTIIMGNCSAYWPAGACDIKNKPLYCNNGTIENRSDICGCDGNSRPYASFCIPKVMCSDGTFSPDCSVNRPFQCVNGTLVERASNCACLSDASFKMIGDVCINVSGTEAYAIEQKIHKLINIERQKNGLKALEFDDELTAVARAHSQDMVDSNYLEHTNLEGKGPADRASNAGYYCYKNNSKGRVLGSIGENIGLAYAYGNMLYANGIEIKRDWYSSDAVAEAVVKGWMNSPEHRANILTANFTNEGVGVAIAIDGRILLTQDFC